MNIQGLPVYMMTLGDEADGVSCISLVEYPAIEKNFMLFSEDEKKKLCFADEERHVISGPAMIPDLPIYRCDETGYEFYVVFSKDTIEKSAQRFFKNGNQANVSLQHEYDVNNVYVFESYIVDAAKGLKPNFVTVPDGTWMLSMKVEDPALWDEIKNTNLLNGFSIETVNTVQKMNKVEKLDVQEQAETRRDWLDELLDMNDQA